MIECLPEIGINDLQIVAKFYWDQSTTVRTEIGVTRNKRISNKERDETGLCTISKFIQRI